MLALADTRGERPRPPGTPRRWNTAKTVLEERRQERGAEWYASADVFWRALGLDKLP